MALELNLTYLQYNDATKLVFTDVSSGWNDTVEVDDITEAVLKLTSYPANEEFTANLLPIFQAAGNDPSNLIYELDNEFFDKQPGGIIANSLYYVDYHVDGAPIELPAVMPQLLILVDGDMQIKIFSKLMDAPLEIDMLDQLVLYREQDWELVVEPLMWYTYYQGMHASIYESKKIQVDNILNALESITKNM